jgi:hypothetical protein
MATTGDFSLAIDNPSNPGRFTLWTCRLYSTPDGVEGAPSIEQLGELLKVRPSEPSAAN